MTISPHRRRIDTSRRGPFLYFPPRSFFSGCRAISIEKKVLARLSLWRYGDRLFSTDILDSRFLVNPNSVCVCVRARECARINWRDGMVWYINWAKTNNVCSSTAKSRTGVNYGLVFSDVIHLCDYDDMPDTTTVILYALWPKCERIVMLVFMANKSWFVRFEHEIAPTNYPAAHMLFAYSIVDFIPRFSMGVNYSVGRKSKSWSMLNR